MLYIILFIQYNGLEHTESDDKMVKEYLREKADSLTAEKERLTAQKERLDGIRERLHKSIDEVQKKEDVDFEIFSPRADMRVSKEMLNEMHQQMNDVKRQQAQTARERQSWTSFCTCSKRCRICRINVSYVSRETFPGFWNA